MESDPRVTSEDGDQQTTGKLLAREKRTRATKGCIGLNAITDNGKSCPDRRAKALFLREICFEFPVTDDPSKKSSTTIEEKSFLYSISGF
jgi:hypothetical protein